MDMQMTNREFLVLVFGEGRVARAEGRVYDRIIPKDSPSNPYTWADHRVCADGKCFMAVVAGMESAIPGEDEVPQAIGLAKPEPGTPEERIWYDLVDHIGRFTLANDEGEFATAEGLRAFLDRRCSVSADVVAFVTERREAVSGG